MDEFQRAGSRAVIDGFEKKFDEDRSAE